MGQQSSYLRCILPHQIVKGQWFVTVKVLNDPVAEFPETELGTGVDCVEVEISDEVTVRARVAISRLREQTFILVEGMGVRLHVFGLIVGLGAAQ